MTLATMNWTRVSVHKVILAALIAERPNLETRLQILPRELSSLLDSPNLVSITENHMRLRLLCLLKGPLLAELPPDTKWYEVHHLTDKDLSTLRVIAHIRWDDTDDDNELLKVAKRMTPAPLRQLPAEWKSIILWGHEKSGPFTIVEGNHRLIAYASRNLSELKIPVFVGLSHSLFYFHIHDSCRFVANDLFIN
jgi:hypothetical protein